MSFEATKNLSSVRMLVKALEMEWNAISDYGSPRFDRVCSGGSKRSDRVSSLVARREALMRSLTTAMEACQNLEDASRSELDSVDNLEMKAMITFRYVHNMAWADIAKKMGEGITADAVKKRFERGLKAYEEQNVTVKYTNAEKKALLWLTEALNRTGRY